MTVEIVVAEDVDRGCLGYDMRPLQRGGRSFRPCMAPALAAVFKIEDGQRELIGFACSYHARQLEEKAE